jgi:hypothetical protein
MLRQQPSHRRYFTALFEQAGLTLPLPHPAVLRRYGFRFHPAMLPSRNQDGPSEIFHSEFRGRVGEAGLVVFSERKLVSPLPIPLHLTEQADA